MGTQAVPWGPGQGGRDTGSAMGTRTRGTGHRQCHGDQDKGDGTQAVPWRPGQGGRDTGSAMGTRPRGTGHRQCHGDQAKGDTTRTSKYQLGLDLMTIRTFTVHSCIDSTRFICNKLHLYTMQMQYEQFRNETAASNWLIELVMHSL